MTSVSNNRAENEQYSDGWQLEFDSCSRPPRHNLNKVNYSQCIKVHMKSKFLNERTGETVIQHFLRILASFPRCQNIMTCLIKLLSLLAAHFKLTYQKILYISSINEEKLWCFIANVWLYMIKFKNLNWFILLSWKYTWFLNALTRIRNKEAKNYLIRISHNSKYLDNAKLKLERCYFTYSRIL